MLLHSVLDNNGIAFILDNTNSDVTQYWIIVILHSVLDNTLIVILHSALDNSDITLSTG